MLDEEYNKVANYTYDSWGKIISITDKDGNKITDENNIALINQFRYRSYYYDSESEMYYLNSRYYNPDTGRFLNADSILGANEDEISYNLYAYVSNNPINCDDPTGELVQYLGAFLVGYLMGYDIANAILNPTRENIAVAAAGFIPGVGPVKGASKMASGVYKGASKAVTKVTTRSLAKGGTCKVTSSVAKRYDKNQQVLLKLAQEEQRWKGGISMNDAKILEQWGKEYGMRARIDMGHPGRSAYNQNPHFHIGNGSIHIRIFPE